jgi:apolipoprotein D and lipocalin family protein
MKRACFGCSRLAMAVLMPLLGLAGCQSAPLPELPRTRVDLPRFMGDWYVIANIPTVLEKGAHNAVESYALAADGTISTTFTFRAGSFGGERKRYQPRGFVRDRDSNDLWGMRFIWPIKADYRITHVSTDYSQTVISRQKRDYVWIMARTPQIPAADYDRLLALVKAQGYDVSQVQRVPQQWPQP